MTYDLPRTESGGVDLEEVAIELRWGCSSMGDSEELAIIKAIDTNARAEERERCARMCDSTFEELAAADMNDPYTKMGLETTKIIAGGIRSMGDE